MISTDTDNRPVTVYGIFLSAQNTHNNFKKVVAQFKKPVYLSTECLVVEEKQSADRRVWKGVRERGRRGEARDVTEETCHVIPPSYEDWSKTFYRNKNHFYKLQPLFRYLRQLLKHIKHKELCSPLSTNGVPVFYSRLSTVNVI